ncbi:MAG: hypothetical protein EA382_01585 [Spirochaetaceae bacterium]|nr:MAG: hypothetical protein EA382_01585 [Spirochaetaceae bacterium]
MSLSIDGVSVDATIDRTARTVTAIVPPVDLARVQPAIGLSPGATLVGVPAFADGVPTSVAVSPTFGRPVNWSVTIHVSPGASFLFDGVRIVLTAGYTDSSDPEQAAAWGHGAPGGSWSDNGFEFWIYEMIDDLGSEDQTSGICLWVTLPEIAVGEYSIDDDDAVTLGYWDDTLSVTASELTVIVATSPSSVGEYMTGSFQASLSGKGTKGDKTKEGTEGGGPPAHTLSDGFFKVVRVADNIWSY